MKTLRCTARRLFAIDLRSLALFRILTAGILLADLANRLTDLGAHYTDAGTLPREAVIQLWSYPGDMSMHFVSGDAVVMLLFFMIAAAAAFSLLIGYRARLSCFLSWALLASLHTRNPLILQGGDELLRALLFFATFLPLGARYSVDEAPAPRSSESPRPTTVLSIGSAALLLQVCLMYWFTAILKSGHVWMPDGTAVEYALRIEQFAKPLGVWLRDFPAFLRYLTWSTWWLELLGPFLLFVPIFFVPLRLAAIAGFWGFHLGLSSTMELGIFPYVSAAAMVPFIPGEVWDFLSRRFSGAAGILSGGRGPALRASKPANAAAGLFLLLAIWWNASSVKSWGLPSFDALDWFQNATRFEETWDMFAPYPLREDGWYVIPGKLEDGSEVDVYRGLEQPVRWEQPERVSATYKNDRWRSYLMNLWQADYEKYRGYYAEYLCRNWNEGKPAGRRLASLHIYFVETYVHLPPQTSEAKRVDLWDQSCLEAEKEPPAIGGRRGRRAPSDESAAGTD